MILAKRAPEPAIPRPSCTTRGRFCTTREAVFLCDSGYNSSRGNKPYKSCESCSEKATEENNETGGESEGYPGNSNWTSGAHSSGAWETS